MLTLTFMVLSHANCVIYDLLNSTGCIL